MQKLERSASGLRHLRWGREILATLEAHHEHNPGLSLAERDLVLDEVVKLRALVNALSAAVKPYRDFLERRRTSFRGMLRVGRFLCLSARARAEKALLPHGAEGALSPDRTTRSRGQGEGPQELVEETRAASAAVRRMAAAVPDLAENADDLADAAAILEGFHDALKNLEARERAPLKAALGAAIDALRTGLSAMDLRLSGALSPALADSLYPPLARASSIVADAGDDDDDAAAGA
jgi:hypothetical protein